MNYKNIVNFIYEMYYLTWMYRSGWGFLGLKNCETTAFHELGSGRESFFITFFEKNKHYNISPERAAASVSFHDSFEVRTGDPNAVSKKYIEKKDEMAQKAFCDMISGLNRVARERIFTDNDNFENRKNKIGIIGKEADRLQMLKVAKYLQESGFKAASEWIDGAISKFKMPEVIKIAERIRDTPSFSKMIPNPQKKEGCLEREHQRIMIAKIAFILACVEQELRNRPVDIDLVTCFGIFYEIEKDDFIIDYYRKFFPGINKQIDIALRRFKRENIRDKSIEAKIIDDAILLEKIFFQKISFDQLPCFVSCELTWELHRFRTESAKKIGIEACKTTYTQWWQDLCKK